MSIADCFLVSLALTASGMLTAGLFLPGWSEQPVVRDDKSIVISYQGIWERCDYRASVLQITDVLDFMRATEVLVSIGQFLLFVAVITFGSYECVSEKRRKNVRIVIGAAALLSALFVIPGIMIFAINLKTGFDVCFGLAVASSGLCILASILAFASTRAKPGEAP